MRTPPLCQLDWELHLDSEGQVTKLDTVSVSHIGVYTKPNMTEWEGDRAGQSHCCHVGVCAKPNMTVRRWPSWTLSPSHWCHVGVCAVQSSIKWEGDRAGPNPQWSAGAYKQHLLGEGDWGATAFGEGLQGRCWGQYQTRGWKIIKNTFFSFHNLFPEGVEVPARLLPMASTSRGMFLGKVWPKETHRWRRFEKRTGELGWTNTSGWNSSGKAWATSSRTSRFLSKFVINLSAWTDLNICPLSRFSGFRERKTQIEKDIGRTDRLLLLQEGSDEVAQSTNTHQVPPFLWGREQPQRRPPRRDSHDLCHVQLWPGLCSGHWFSSCFPSPKFTNMSCCIIHTW